MPKMKTKSSAKKRFKLTGSGKIKRKHAFKSHILTKKSKKRKLRLTHSGLVHESDVTSIKQQLRLVYSFTYFWVQFRCSYKDVSF